MPSPAEVAELEAVAYDVWRAPEVEELDGWRLRFAHGLTGRGNSVWPNGEGALPLPQRIEQAERWYEARGRPALFQLTEAARPAGLDDALAERGYELRGGPVAVETARLADVAAATSGDSELSAEPDARWIRLWAGTRGFARLDVARAMLTGSPGATAFARIGDVAVGRGVVVDGWLGITSMATAPEARRRGHARAIVHALTRWAQSLGATRALLQVEESNEAARSLYRSVGFVQSHAYRYRIRP
jgi:N-acetylglutamate synthase